MARQADLNIDKHEGGNDFACEPVECPCGATGIDKNL
jgi:hypothetical protein